MKEKRGANPGIMRVLPLTAVYSEMPGPKFHTHLSDSLNIGPEVLKDEVGVAFYTKTHYRSFYDHNNTLVQEPEEDQMRYRIVPGGNHNLLNLTNEEYSGILGIANVAYSAWEREDRIHNTGSTDFLTLTSFRIFCRTGPGHGSYADGHAALEELSIDQQNAELARQEKHNESIPIESGLLTVDKDGVIMPICYDGSWEIPGHRGVGYFSFQQETLVFEPLVMNLMESIGELREEHNKQFRSRSSQGDKPDLLIPAWNPGKQRSVEFDPRILARRARRESPRGRRKHYR